MFALLKKDWRLNRPVIVGHAILFAISSTILYPFFRGNSTTSHVHTEWSGGLWVTMVMAAVYGGIAFTRERREGSAAFMAMMPIGRVRIVLSKLCVAGGCLGVAWLISTMLMFISGAIEQRHELFTTQQYWQQRSNRAAPRTRMQDLPAIPTPGTASVWQVRYQHGQAPDAPSVWQELRQMAQLDLAEFVLTIGVLAFGLAWLLGSFLSSAAIAASIALASVIVILRLIALLVASWFPGSVLPAVTFPTSVITAECGLWGSWVIGIGCILIGAVYYIVRVEP